MRLIDADELKKAIYKRSYYIDDYEEAIKVIDNAPTVEANSIIDGLNNEIDDLSENLAWYVNEGGK